MTRLNPNTKTEARRLLFVAFVSGLVFLVCSTVLTVRSYSRSDSLTFADATICTDEGLISFQIPLVRLARTEQATTRWMSYARGDKMWEAGNGGKATLRNWMSILDETGCDGGMFAGSGYWKGDWQSDSRPGPFIVTFVPIWTAVAATLAFVAVFLGRRVKFQVRSILVCTVLVGGLLWLLTLRAVQ